MSSIVEIVYAFNLGGGCKSQCSRLWMRDKCTLED